MKQNDLFLIKKELRPVSRPGPKRDKCAHDAKFKEVHTPRAMQVVILQSGDPASRCLLKFCARGASLASP